MLYSLPLRIHVWGGLGSQLHAWALAESIRKSTNRPISLILHSSGVTKRSSDLGFLGDYFHIRSVEDFTLQTEPYAKMPLFKSALSLLVKRVMKMTKLSLGDDFLESANSVLPWTFSLRGHYSNIYIEQDTIMEILAKSFRHGLLDDKAESKTGTIIHYRLGDLLNLDSKRPLSEIRFKGLENLRSPFYVISDSPEVAQARLNQVLGTNVEIINENSAWAAINAALNYECFIGTPSKLSFWIIAFRSFLNKSGVMYITKEHLEHLNFILKFD